MEGRARGAAWVPLVSFAMPDGVSVQPAANLRRAGVDVAPRQIHITDNLDLLLEVLPSKVGTALQQQSDLETLLEVVLDLGRRPEARFPGRVLYLDEGYVAHEDIRFVTSRVGAFGKDNRAGIERTRRMQVPHPELQHAVMIEAVENHMPQVIVIDEIGTEAEALAARTIAERGVQLITTAHGNTLDNLLQNPTLSDLVGGIQAVTLSDEEAR